MIVPNPSYKYTAPIEPEKTDSLAKKSTPPRSGDKIGSGDKPPTTGSKPPTIDSKKKTGSESLGLNDRALKSTDPSKKVKTSESINFNDRAKASDPMTIGSKDKKSSSKGSAQLNDRESAGPLEEIPENIYGIMQFEDPMQEPI